MLEVVEASAAFFYEMDRDIDGHVTPEESPAALCIRLLG